MLNLSGLTQIQTSHDKTPSPRPNNLVEEEISNMGRKLK